MSHSLAPHSAFRAVALQTATHAVNRLGPDEAREAIVAAIDRIGAEIASTVAWYGSDTRLVVLPEYALTGFPMGDAVDAWAHKAGLAPGGREYDALAAIAQRQEIYLLVNAYETDQHYPGLYFQASVLLTPSGDVALRYRRLHSLYSPSPYDVWDSYLEHYGLDGALPVADTEIGHLAAIASEEILYPELARALAMRGAEVFCHATSEAIGPDPSAKEIARRSRAVENIAAVVTANTGGLRNIPIPEDATNGHSEIVDHLGNSLARAGFGQSCIAAEIDLAALRRERRRPTMSNLPARVASGLWATEYARREIVEPNGLADHAAERSFFALRHQASIDKLHEAGAIQ